MNLLSGLEKFGLDISKGSNLFEDEEVKRKKPAEGGVVVEQHIPTEEEFLLEKKVQCKICDKTFKTILVKNGKIKRLEPDKDLRPRFQYIDTLKYDITSCPYCGYTAMNRYFEHIVPAQMKLIREEISSKFQPTMISDAKTISYEEALERYKLSLINTIVKKGKNSERAYTCLKIAWLLRGKAETMPEGTEEEKKAKAACKQEEEMFYKQAYEGLMLATTKEMFPICGMEQSTVDYMLSYMSYHFGKYEIASKYLASVVTSAAASRRMKDMALELKEEILEKLKK